MFQKNQELRRSLTALFLVTLVMTGIGAFISPLTGVLILAACSGMICIFLLTEAHRYRRLQKLSTDLDELLISGTPLPIMEYAEGELSILANQIQKITLLLKESAQKVRSDRKYLADSLADISHQLRTPLTAINLTASMLRKPELSTERRIELTGELITLLSRTDWLVETLLKLSKLDAGTVDLVQKSVRVKDVIARASEPLAIQMDLRSQQLRLHCGDEAIKCDPVWTAEALGNILKNCTEHTPQGGTITVTVSQTPLFTQIEIRDTGPGFDPVDIPHLFERFYKGTNASQNSYGIGLALARTVISAQNGTIRALNGETGAQFLIKLYHQVI